MKVLHVCDENAGTGSGVLAAVRAYAAGVRLSRPDADVQLALPAVAGADSPADGANLPTSALLRGMRGGWAMKAELERLVAQADVVHVHSVWFLPELIAAHLATRARRPWLLTVHGMLQPAEYARKHAKKQMFWSLVGRPVFSRAPLVHAITRQEQERLRHMLPGARIEVVPNGVDLARADTDGAAGPSVPDPARLVFFGRIVPGKGADLLIRAIARAEAGRCWTLDLVGPCAPAYQRELGVVAREEGVADRVRFVGAVVGREKWLHLKCAWLAAMPSVSEVVGMANLEAAAAGVPTLVCPGAGLEGWAEAGGIVSLPDVTAIAQALGSASAWSAAEREQRARGLRRLIERRYSVEVIGGQLYDLYRRLVRAPLPVDARPGSDTIQHPPRGD